MKMVLQKRKSGWWFGPLPNTPPQRCWCGPYRTKASAADDKRGVERFYEVVRKEFKKDA